MISKKALLVGINYKKTDNELKGCINDVKDIRKLLISKYGYSNGDITLLTDDTDMKPTRDNIMSSLLTLVMSGATNLMFHYSGHGAAVKDVTGTEKNGFNECIAPLDFMQNGLIIDGDIRNVLVCMQPSSSITVVMDCCHSGTGCDLPYVLYEKEGKCQMIENTSFQETHGSVIMISGCLDDQTAADANEAHKHQGAMTYCLIQTIKKNKAKLSYEALYLQIRDLLKKEGFKQIPNVSSGKSLDITTSFTI